MSRKTRYPQSRPASLVAIAFLAALIGVGVPASVGGLFHGYVPHDESGAATAAKAPVRGARAG